MKKPILHSKQFLFVLFTLLLTTPLTSYAQSLSFGVFTDYSRSVFDITSRSIIPTINGETKNKISYSSKNIDTLNIFHDFHRKYNTYGIQCNYDFKRADSAKFGFHIGLGVGVGTYEYWRYANYDGTTYYEYTGNQFIAESENIDWNFKFNFSSSYYFTPNISLDGVVSCSYHLMKTTKIDDILISNIDEYDISTYYKSKVLKSSFDLYLHYNVDGFNIFIGPRVYYNYQWTDYEINTLDIDDNIEYIDLIQSTYVEKSLFKLSGGMNYIINKKVGIGIQLVGNQNSFAIFGQINYYLN